ncbi:HU family DNA-binding protein [Actinosynnema pretiosum subsp. pretiosum]|uniref:Histone family protein DNA-binding protein n=2 Tax=Actinosynnema TaxID=40566 RepID=C6WM87_ACTMD|nr:HU family DNA-binding protein [Actinosynnema mirum]ACU34821.1 histone family protein DNA-binding protein [Actinosynnema mirum DSM 43827]AXX28186.1 DNA-binding protein HU-beta [Actinosynnema pretiosum subsp. pretiosum]QUF07440.1 HU family DNA-binding protein [Actinosynnema pretiosum subsp. pretiosum]
MNKAELVSAIAEGADVEKAVATRALDAVLDSITKALAQGDDVVLTGFGSFTVKERAARTGRNPQTGEAIEIAASKAVGFKVGKALKDAVN